MSGFLDGLAKWGLGQPSKLDVVGSAGGGTEFNTSVMSPEQWQDFGAKGGTVGDTGKLNYGATDTGFGMGALGKGVGLATDAFGAYTGYKQLGLAEDAFNFNKGMKEKEYAMAKDAYDRQVKRAADVGAQMRAGKVG